MKKTLLAAALIVGFAGVAQAETSVTMYGILDTGYGYQNYKFDKNNVTYKNTGSGLTSGIFNGNRWGVRGSEDLGNGLRAIFNLEAGFDIGNGNTNDSDKLFHRQAWVGLASDSWGTLTMGRQYNIGTATTYANNMGVSMGDMDKTFGGLGLGNRMDNSFKYMTPSFSGFQLGVAYGNANKNVSRLEVAGVSASISDRSNWLSTGLKYANGPINVAASYDRASNSLDNATTNWTISGSYDFEVVKLALAYGQDRYGKLGWGGDSMTGGVAGAARGLAALGAIGNDFKSSNYYVGLSAPVGTGTLAATWNRSSSNLDDADKWGDNAKAQNIYHLNYSYPLSKRTKVYAYGSYGTGIAYIDGLKGREAGVGLNHQF